MKRERQPIIPQEGLEIIQYSVKSRGDHSIFIRSYIPTGRSNLPLIIYLHGGGFVSGGLETGWSATLLSKKICLLTTSGRRRSVSSYGEGAQRQCYKRGISLGARGSISMWTRRLPRYSPLGTGSH
jgi:hypothetical protein